MNQRKLKININFQPCPIDDEDELYPNGIFVFNITKMAEYIQNTGIPKEEIQVKDFTLGSSKIKEDYVETVDVYGTDGCQDRKMKNLSLVQPSLTVPVL